MDLVGDRRGQSIQVGAVLLFGALIIAFASYQAFVVPDQNRGVEFNHNQQVQSELQDLRNAIVSVGGSDERRSVTVALGTRYPSRLVARNPSPPSGSLETVGTDSDSVGLRISNAQAAGESARETGDFWNDSQRYTTGVLRYRPSYNVYASAPTTTYEHTVLYNRFDSGTITLANQSLVDGTEISLVVLNGTLSRASTEATSVDVRAVSSSTERVRIEDDGTGPVNITFASTRSAAYWDFLENTQPSVTSVTNASSGNGFYNVSVELQQGQTYTLKLTKVGVGTGVTGEDAAYLTDVEGDGASVSQGETTELTLEVRDRFNNPPDDISAVRVNASVAGSGSLRSTSKVPDEDGQVTFTYEAPSSGTGSQEVQFSYVGIDGSFDATTRQNVSMTVDVTAPSGGGGGAYAVTWTRPPFSQRIVSEQLVFRDGSSPLTESVGLRSIPFLARATGSGTTVAYATLDYSVSDGVVVRPVPTVGETDGSGYNGTVVQWQSDGRSSVFVASGGTGDEATATFDRLLNESFEHPNNALVSNGWQYNNSAGEGDSGVVSSVTAPAGSRVAYISGPASTTADRAVELNYTLDTGNYDTISVSYVAREPTADDDADTPDSGSNWEPGENLRVQYLASDGSWVTIDNISAQEGDRSVPYDQYRRTVIEDTANASHSGFRLRFVQRETTADDEWRIDAVDVVGATTSSVTAQNQAPVPAFRYSPDSPTSGESVTFDANRSDDPDDSDIASYQWDFGDGTTANGEQVSHSYGSDGSYTVTLTVTDGRGATATTTQTVSVGSGGGGGTRDPGFAYEDVNQDGLYQSGTDTQLSKSTLQGTYSAGAGNGLVVPDSVGAFNTNTDIDWSADGMFVGVDVSDDSSVTLDAGSGQLTLDGTQVQSLGAITATGDTVDVGGVSVDNYRNGNGNGQPVQITATGGSLSAANLQVAAPNDITLDGDGVTATGATLDNYQNANGAGSIDVTAGSGTADLGSATVRSLDDINVTGTDVTVSGATLDNYQNGNGNGRAIRLEASGGDVTATNSATVDSYNDIVVSGTNVDVSTATLDNDQNANGAGSIDVTATDSLTGTSTSFQSLNDINVTGGTVDVSSATVNNYQNGNGNGRAVRVDATAGSLTGTGLNVDSNEAIRLTGDTMDISDSDLNNYQNGNGQGDIRLETRSGDMVVERAVLTTNDANRAFVADTSGDDLFVQNGEFYQGNTNGNNGSLVNENNVDVNGTPARGSVS
ncbi:PKD domain-containing protein [Haloarcula onubensis]|uniref:PKD domain-containing protein n=1 Tax=Haloarcula onubensis TaxID=2950539 RepID=A0ABU2FS11_9EURY|nr:PKD domain-containing protein [Halomicroarcula sp. S3CR25-11]MDS0283553.1 PKD domain-containing protein [Halomicroarcula sp. S3CR25-11]